MPRRRILRVVTGTAAAALVTHLTLGAIHQVTELSEGWIGLDSELEMRSPWYSSTFNIPVLMSGLVLLLGGLLWWVVAVHQPRYRTSAAVLGSLLVWMSLDEVFVIHEYIETNVGVDWVILYFPIMVGAGMFTVLLLRRLWARLHRPAMLLVLGSGAWVVAQMLETIQWDGDTPRAGYKWFVYFEETLEITGSYLMALSAAALLRARTGATSMPRHLTQSRVRGSAPRQASPQFDPGEHDLTHHRR